MLGKRASRGCRPGLCDLVALGVLGLASALPACGGADQDGSPNGTAGTSALPTDGGQSVADVSQAPAGDPCCAADGLGFQNIVSFETTIGRCDPAVDPTPTQQTNCLYFNYDHDTDPPPDPVPPNWVPVLHSPPDCLTPDSPGTCTLPGGQVASAGLCSQSNLAQGSIVTSLVEGDGRCGMSKAAMHLVSKNLSICVSGITGQQGYGSTLFVTFNVSPSGISTAAYDASAWEGVSFWTRNGTGPTGGSFRAFVLDPYTGPYAGRASLPQQVGGYCASTSSSYCGSAARPCMGADGGPFTTPDGGLIPTTPASARCDPFGAVVPVSGDWRLVKLSFAQLKQGGLGMASPLGRVDSSALLGLEFLLSPGDWDLWLDDIAFYRDSPQAMTCVDGARIDIASD